MCQVLVLAHGIFNLHCSMQDLWSQHVGSRFLTGDQTGSPCMRAWSLSRWTTKEVP